MMLNKLKTYAASMEPRGRIRLWVSPKRILYPKTSREWPRYVKSWPFLGCPGRWDQYKNLHNPFREQSLREVLTDQPDFRKSAKYARLVRTLERDGRTNFHDRNCTSVAEIDAYFERVKTLAERMRAEGYQPVEVTGANGDIDVRISRSGQLLKCGEGTHRLAIARILELPRVLVRVDLIHTEFFPRLGFPAPKELQCRLKKFFNGLTDRDENLGSLRRFQDPT